MTFSWIRSVLNPVAAGSGSSFTWDWRGNRSQPVYGPKAFLSCKAKPSPVVYDITFITVIYNTWNMAETVCLLPVIFRRWSVVSACHFIGNLNLLLQEQGGIKFSAEPTEGLQETQMWPSSSKNIDWTRLQLPTNTLLTAGLQMLLIKERNLPTV